MKFTHGIAINAENNRGIICNIRETLCKMFYSLFISILFSKLPKRKSYQFHVVTRHSYIFTLIFMIEFLTISLLLIVLSGTYVRFRKQSRDDEVTERRGEKKEKEKEEDKEANRFDSVTSQAKRTEDKRKNRASEGQKQHGSNSGSIEKRPIDPWYYADVHVSCT